MKADKFRQMTEEELNHELVGLRKNLMNLRTKKVVEQIEDTSAFKKMKKDVARILTILAEKKKAGQTEKKDKLQSATIAKQSRGGSADKVGGAAGSGAK